MEASEGPDRRIHCEEQHMNYGYQQFHQEEQIQEAFQ